MQRHQNVVELDPNTAESNEMIPPKMHRKFTVNIVYGPNSKVKLRSIGELFSIDIGALIMIKAIVVRVSEVKPLLSVATFTCDVCGC